MSRTVLNMEKVPKGVNIDMEGTERELIEMIGNALITTPKLLSIVIKSLGLKDYYETNKVPFN